MSQQIYQFKVTRIDGSEAVMSEFEGQVLLIVNTASKCGFTPQYKGLQTLHEEYADKGLAILGFPCDQFGHQEPGDDGEIAQFCELNFGVSFPMFSKIQVNGDDADPLFAWLKRKAPGVLGSESIKWNFTKFLVARDGTVLSRYASKTNPNALRKDIEAALASDG